MRAYCSPLYCIDIHVHFSRLRTLRLAYNPNNRLAGPQGWTAGINVTKLVSITSDRNVPIAILYLIRRR